MVQDSIKPILRLVNARCCYLPHMNLFHSSYHCCRSKFDMILNHRHSTDDKYDEILSSHILADAMGYTLDDDERRRGNASFISRDEFVQVTNISQSNARFGAWKRFR